MFLNLKKPRYVILWQTQVRVEIIFERLLQEELYSLKRKSMNITQTKSYASG